MIDDAVTPAAPLVFEILVATLLGLFVGLERERSRVADKSNGDAEPAFAGIRTFAIVSLTGLGAALVGEKSHPAVFAAGLAIVGLLAAISHFAAAPKHQGTTTEVAFVLTYLVGGLVHYDRYLLAATLALVLTATLAMKRTLHGFARAVSNEDIYSALKFGAITLVVLPLLPDRTFDPLDAVNPRHVWLMVVLMSGIGFVGYVLVKIFGTRAGTGLTGFLGGLVSSTVTTLTFSQRSREAPTLSGGFAVAILLACTVMYLRVMVVVFVTNKALAWALLPAFGAITAVALAATAIVHFAGRAARDEQTARTEYANPFRLMPSIQFAAVFTVVLVVVKLAQREFGERGIFIASFVAGLTDMDAVTLSVSRLRGGGDGGGLDSNSAVVAIVLASVANTVVKTGIVLVAGARGLRMAAGIPLAVIALASVGVVLFMP
jgi:uncharacterized membrane protein (DUF4010 family)